MPRHSAGIVLFRRARGRLEVFLVHPGGPFWFKKDLGAWSICKGEYEPSEDALAAAQREFEEETGTRLEGAPFIPLGEVKQKGGKIVAAWGFESDCDAASIRSNTFTTEWPPRSGRMQSFPEVDRAAWFGLDEARNKLLPSQIEFLDRLSQSLASPGSDA